MGTDGKGGGAPLPPVWVSKEAEGEGDELIWTPSNHPQICGFTINPIWGFERDLSDRLN
ncbi:hypothetical protein SLEP1_g59898 [Rubroshorea leprosula]|uniref:Uncharacterized protein n=1 Tax=Rubroshorea leprosula TaxID=152421 RepID=A0AAV5MU61_9ROSI|nr:hypothetical protein SLEP1_g59898 [Rubroshorea leprosula]